MIDRIERLESDLHAARRNTRILAASVSIIGGLLLVGWGEGGGFNGFPNTLIYDTWQGRTTSTTLNVPSGATLVNPGNQTIQAANNLFLQFAATGATQFREGATPAGQVSGNGVAPTAMITTAYFPSFQSGNAGDLRVIADGVNGVIHFQTVTSATGTQQDQVDVSGNGLTFPTGATGGVNGNTGTDLILQSGSGKNAILNALGAGNAKLQVASTDVLSFTGSVGTWNVGTFVGPAGGDLGLGAGASHNLNLLDAGGTTRIEIDHANGIEIQGGSAIKAMPWIVSGNVGAAVTNATKDFSVFHFPAAANGAATYTPKACSFTVNVAGLTGGTCTYVFRDATSSTALCTISQSCTTAALSGSEITCAASGSIAAGDVVSFRVTAPASDTAALGDWQCTGTM